MTTNFMQPDFVAAWTAGGMRAYSALPCARERALCLRDYPTAMVLDWLEDVLDVKTMQELDVDRGTPGWTCAPAPRRV